MDDGGLNVSVALKKFIFQKNKKLDKTKKGKFKKLKEIKQKKNYTKQKVKGFLTQVYFLKNKNIRCCLLYGGLARRRMRWMWNYFFIYF